LENRNSSIIELVERYVYFNAHFGKSFETCQSLYKQDVLNKINKSVSTDLEVYQQEEEVQQEKVIYQKEKVQQEKVIYQEEEVIYQEEEVEKKTDDELDFDPDKEWLKYLETDKY
ncbi:25035_t:CDS:1, partial [Racocetra persica]